MSDRLFAAKISAQKGIIIKEIKQIDQQLRVLILAAGKGLRMQSELPKVLHELHGKPLLSWVLGAVQRLKPLEIMVVLGHKAEMFDPLLSAHSDSKLKKIIQREQLGTGHAVQVALKDMPQEECDILVLPGDVPLIKATTLANLLARHRQNRTQLTVLTAEVKDACGYGRIVRDTNDKLIKIVEEKDATEREKSIKEINSGIYLFCQKMLQKLLPKLNSNNCQKEYYLTDILDYAVSAGYNCQAFKGENSLEIEGVNSQEQLQRLALKVELK